MALLERGLKQRIVSHADIAAALDAQCAKATADDVILLFGSFYSVAEGLEWLARRTDKGE